MLKITLRQLNDGFQSLQRIADKELPAKLAYKLGRVCDAAQSEMRAYQKQINKLFEKYGEKQKNGQHKLLDENTEAFTNEADELLDAPVEIWGDPITIEELEPHCKLKAGDLAQLGWLIVSDEKPAEEKSAAATA